MKKPKIIYVLMWKDTRLIYGVYETLSVAKQARDEVKRVSELLILAWPLSSGVNEKPCRFIVYVERLICKLLSW